MLGESPAVLQKTCALHVGLLLSAECTGHCEKPVVKVTPRFCMPAGSPKCFLLSGIKHMSFCIQTCFQKKLHVFPPLAACLRHSGARVLLLLHMGTVASLYVLRMHGIAVAALRSTHATRCDYTFQCVPLACLKLECCF